MEEIPNESPLTSSEPPKSYPKIPIGECKQQPTAFEEKVQSTVVKHILDSVETSSNWVSPIDVILQETQMEEHSPIKAELEEHTIENKALMDVIQVLDHKNEN